MKTSKQGVGRQSICLKTHLNTYLHFDSLWHLLQYILFSVSVQPRKYCNSDSNVFLLVRQKVNYLQVSYQNHPSHWKISSWVQYKHHNREYNDKCKVFSLKGSFSLKETCGIQSLWVAVWLVLVQKRNTWTVVTVDLSLEGSFWLYNMPDLYAA